MLVTLAASWSAAPAFADDVRDQSWHLATLQVDEAHQVTRGEGVVVAVVDTGVDPTHPDLQGNVEPGVDVLDPENRDRGQRDHTGHGTAVASLIAGHGHGPNNDDGVLGIAPEATIVPYNVYDERVDGAAPGATAQAIRLAVDEGADVICVALAGGFERGDEAAVRYANSRDVLVVAGIGNSPAVLVMDPAGVTETVAVTAADHAGNLATTVRGVPHREIDITAPGADIPAAQPGNRYFTSTGTSAATAIVAGSVALLRAVHPDATRNELLQRLVWTTTDAGDAGRDFEYGWGMLNLVRALTTDPQEPPTASSTPDPTSAPPPSSTEPAGGSATSGDGASMIQPGWLVVGLAAVAAAVFVGVGVRRRGR